MTSSDASLPVCGVQIDATAPLGACEWWRHTLGLGGINHLPLPPHVVEGVSKLQPRLIRIFIQEYFDIYPEHGRFNWSILDPYMDSLAATGAKIVASIDIKPKPLYPLIDHSLWQPNDVAEWQQVIAALVQRYSVEKPYVTYWEVGNETDIGENGGTPFLIPDPDDYMQFYLMTIKPILAVFPDAKVGGTAACWIDNEPLVGFIERCRRDDVRLDFISWHRYNNNPEQHVLGVEKAKQRLAAFTGKRPEMLCTEWAPRLLRIDESIDLHRKPHPQYISVEEIAYAPYRAASVAASIIGLLDAGLDWSFYYHIWDQCFYPDKFRPFYSDAGLALMHEHWNEVPHRLGLFGVGEEVRPQYFVYAMLARLGAERLLAQADHTALYTLATHDSNRVSALLVNFELTAARDCVAQLHFTLPNPGEKLLTIYRLDEKRSWSGETFDLIPVEQRTVATFAEYRCQVLLPAYSVALVELEDKP
jgi:xylan 1,4-beta-xylosidase